jgi:hypothetical protein
MTRRSAGWKTAMTAPLLDDPQKRRRTVRALLVLSPLMFVFTYCLAWIQNGTPQVRLHLGLIASIGCLLAALVIHLMGGKSGMALTVTRTLLALLGRR